MHIYFSRIKQLFNFIYTKRNYTNNSGIIKDIKLGAIRLS